MILCPVSVGHIGRDEILDCPPFSKKNSSNWAPSYVTFVFRPHSTPHPDISPEAASPKKPTPSPQPMYEDSGGTREQEQVRNRC